MSKNNDFDFSHLKQTFGDNQDFIKEIALEFLASVPNKISKLENSIEEMKVEKVKYNAHALKGALTLMGLENCHQCMVEIEQACSNFSEDSSKIIKMQFAEFKNMMDENLKSLKAFIDS